MGQIFNFFPLSVLKSKIELSDEKKKKMIEEILVMEKKSKNIEYKNHFVKYKNRIASSV